MTLVGTLGVAAGALVCFPQGWLWRACSSSRAFVFSDLIDGAMARKIGRTDTFGAFLDSTLDRIADAALFGGMALFFAWQADDNLYLVLAWSAWSMGSVTSYARSKGEQLGFTPRPGIAERPDRLVRSGAAGARRSSADVFDDVPWLYEIALWLIAVAEHDHGRPADPARTPPGAGARRTPTE